MECVVPTDAINEGEAANIREQLKFLQEGHYTVREAQRLHEQKCTSRMALIIVGLAISITLNLPAAWPKILEVLTMLAK